MISFTGTHSPVTVMSAAMCCIANVTELFEVIWRAGWLSEFSSSFFKKVLAFYL